MYEIIWDKAALKDLKQLDRPIAKQIVKKVHARLKENPETLGKPLVGQFKGLFRYRLGDYRIIYELCQKQVIVIIVRVGHRSMIYK